MFGPGSRFSGAEFRRSADAANLGETAGTMEVAAFSVLQNPAGSSKSLQFMKIEAITGGLPLSQATTGIRLSEEK